MRRLFLSLLLLWLPLAAGAADSVWLGDLKGVPEPTESDAKILAIHLYEKLVRGNSGAEFPAALTHDETPRVAIVTLGGESGPPRILTAPGRGYRAAAAKAEDAATTASEPGFKPTWLRLDLAFGVVQEPLVKSGRLRYVHEFYGIGFGPGSRLALLPDELSGASIVDTNEVFIAQNLESYLKKRLPGDGKAPPLKMKANGIVYRFRTVATLAEDGKAFPLYRSHRSFKNFTKEDLLDAARRAGDYLVRATKEDGEFTYGYIPITDTEPEGYNMLRHAGTLRSMYQLYGVTRDPALLAAAQRALDYLLRAVKPWRTGAGKAAVLVDGGYIKLGGNALAILALEEYAQATGDSRYLPLMKNLALWMMSVQEPNGRFGIHFQAYPGGQVRNEPSEYYPGQAALALARLQTFDLQGPWLGFAERAVRNLIEVRDADLTPEKLIHDHWQLMALNEVYRFHRRQAYLDHAMAIANAMMAAQNLKPRYPDEMGSFMNPPRSTPTATRTEGLLAAYQLARDFGEKTMAEKILESIRLATTYQLGLQARHENSAFLPNPAASLGAFRHSIDDPTIRIDFVQHALSATLGVYGVMMAR